MFRKFFHLQHHRHTGKLLHHRHTSYRSLGFLIIIACSFLLFLALFEQKTKADLLQVSAKVSGAIPTDPAVITQPITGAQVNTSRLTVKGTCEYLNETTIISIYDNGDFAGSTLCTSEGLFTVDITIMSIGGHQLYARTSNITDDYGPDSVPVLLSYVLPQNNNPQSGESQPILPGSSQQTPSVSGKSQLHIKSKDAYLVFGPSKQAVWEGSIEGGSSPYTIVIDWGDGSKDKQENINELQYLTIQHQYKDMKPFYVTVRVTDSDGMVIERTYVAVTPYTPFAIAGNTNYIYIDPNPYYVSVLAYIILAIIVLILWFDAKVYILSLNLRPHHARIGGRNRGVHV